MIRSQRKKHGITREQGAAYLSSAAQNIGVILECCLLSTLLPAGQTALATQVKGQAQLGVDNVEVKYKQDQAGEGTNNRRIAVGRITTEFSQFGIRRDRILFDARDKYDFFGADDPGEALLKEKNTFNVRTAAYQRPYETSPLFFTLGRFPLTEADILANDGAEAGYRLNNALRVGAFGGFAPADIYDPMERDDAQRPQETKAGQGGVYTGLNLRNNATGYYLDSVASLATVPDEQGGNEVFLHNSNTIHFNARHFLFSYLRADMPPFSSLRRAIVNYNYWDKAVRASLTLTQNDPTHIPLFLEARNTLNPSVTRGARGFLQYQLTQLFALNSQVSYAQRTLDGLTRTEYQLGAILKNKVPANTQLAIYGGERKNFNSVDRFARINGTLSTGHWSLNAAQYLASEQYNDGTHRTVTMTDADIGREIGRSLRMAVGARYLNDDTMTITSVLAHIAYIFGRGDSI